MPRRPLLAFMVVLLVGTLAALGVVWGGFVNIGATHPAGGMDRFLSFAAVRSLRHHAPRDAPAWARDPVASRAGLSEYRALCLECHGAPGVDPAEFAAGLHPAAPPLGSPEIQSFTDGMLYQVISEGITSTGMPAFGPMHSAPEVWGLVAFVRHLPQLTPEERGQLLGKGVPTALPAPLPPAGGQQRHSVAITGFKFVPDTLQVRDGDLIEWTNGDLVAHTATGAHGAFDTGRLEPGGSAQTRVHFHGTLSYSCRYHPTMRGTLEAK